MEAPVLRAARRLGPGTLGRCARLGRTSREGGSVFVFDRAAKSRLVTSEEALPGRSHRPFTLAGTHTVLGTPIEGPVPTGYQEVVFGLGCFWGAERIFWNLPGVWTTAVGYAGGYTPHPTYEEVCTGRTGHSEVVRVVYDPSKVSFEQLLKAFWEGHDPTQGMRQGNDVGTQYRSAVYWTTDAQRIAAEESRDLYARSLGAAGFGAVTTEIKPLGEFWYAEDYHQQYLEKNPFGYCPDHSTGVACPIGRGVTATER
ncbi:MAG: peptide-methionine (S)-S-oxide reductase MsrA [Jiangellaceae bacterium]|nr:peptide-methionine (S)-S-oxide reductase MsrA [Jiangellaceae bacterium]